MPIAKGLVSESPVAAIFLLPVVEPGEEPAVSVPLEPALADAGREDDEDDDLEHKLLYTNC
jgi:hypothetical protein